MIRCLIIILILMGAGAFIIYRFSLRRLITNKNWKMPLKPFTPEEKESIVIKIAKEKQGRITPIDVAEKGRISIDDAEKILKNLNNKGYVDIKVDDNGRVYYEFTDYLPNNNWDNNTN